MGDTNPPDDLRTPPAEPLAPVEPAAPPSQPPKPRKPFKPPRTPRVPVEATLPRIVRWGMPLLVLLVSFHFYHAELEEPSIVDFDEAHYIKAARNYTRGVLIDPAWSEPRPQNFEHPPLGKYLIALGIYLHGKPHNEMENQAYLKFCNFDNPECAQDAYAWRIGSTWTAAFGVLGMYWLGLRLFNRLSAGVLASGLLLLDGLYYIHSRLAMLDIFPIAFALLAFGVGLGRTEAHKWASSLIFGCAIGSKFPAFFLLPPFFLMHFLLSRHTHRWMRLRDALLRGIIVPLLVFVALFAPFWKIWYDRGGGGLPGLLYAIDTFTYIEGGALRWTYGGDAGHPYVSAPYAWIPMTRPVFYYVETLANGDVGHIYAIGNPVIWWSASLALLAFWLRFVPRFLLTEGLDLRPSALWDWWRRPFSFTRDTSFGFASLLFASAYGCFFLVKRQQFNFYFLLAAPFLSLLLGGVLSEQWSRATPAARLSVLFSFVAVAVVFVFYYPIYSGIIITQRHFDFVFNTIRWMAR